VATNVKLGSATRAPGGIPSACSVSRRPVVSEDTATTSVPRRAPASFSNDSATGPKFVTRPLSRIVRSGPSSWSNGGRSGLMSGTRRIMGGLRSADVKVPRHVEDALVPVVRVRHGLRPDNQLGHALPVVDETVLVVQAHVPVVHA